MDRRIDRLTIEYPCQPEELYIPHHFDMEIEHNYHLDAEQINAIPITISYDLRT